MLFELMDIETANVIGVYQCEADALAEVRSLLLANGPAYASSLSLAWEDDERDGLIAQGAKLARRARAAPESARA